MAVHRFYLPVPMRVGDILELPQNISHHMIHVLRLLTGEPIVLFNGNGGEFRARLNNVSRKSVAAEVMDFLDDNRSAKLAVHLGMCVIKKDSMDRVIGRATELGVTSITPIISEHCSVSTKVIRQRHQHWHQVAVAACEQCGLNLVPEVLPAIALHEWLANVSTDIRLVCEPGDHDFMMHQSFESASLLVGPEGGLTADEVKASFNSGFQPVSMGERILRAETAPLVALAILQDRFG